MNDTFGRVSNGTMPPPLPSSLVIALTVTYAITLLIAIPGNALGLFIVYRRRSLRNTMNLLIMNMCFADLLLMLVAPPLVLSYVYTQRWVAGLLGDILCKVSQYTVVVTIAVSVLTILFISCERFCAICYPLKGKLLRRPRVVTACIWVLALGIMSPYAVFHKNIYYRNGWVCTMWLGKDATPDLMKIHYLVLFLILYIFPVVLIAALHSIIVYRLARKRMPGENQGSAREVAMRFRHKAVKMLIALLAVFACCWLPTHVMHYIITKRRDVLFKLPKGVTFFAFWLGHFNSALNPIIYVLLSDNFRRDFKTLVLRSSKRTKTFSVKATTSVLISSRERSGSGLGRFSHRFSESLSLKSFPRTPSFRQVNFFECISLRAAAEETPEANGEVPLK